MMDVTEEGALVVMLMGVQVPFMIHGVQIELFLYQFHDIDLLNIHSDSYDPTFQKMLNLE